MKKLALFLVMTAMLALPGLAYAQAVENVSRPAKSGALETLKSLKLRQHAGVILSVDLNRQTVVVKSRKSEHPITIIPETRVNRGREKLRQADLKPGQKVTVEYWEKDGNKIAKSFHLKKD